MMMHSKTLQSHKKRKFKEIDDESLLLNSDVQSKQSASFTFKHLHTKETSTPQPLNSSLLQDEAAKLN